MIRILLKYLKILKDINPKLNSKGLIINTKGLDVWSHILKILRQHRWSQAEQRERNEGKSSENQSLSWRDRQSLIPIILAVIFTASHDMLGSKTANQCPGKLFMPALSLIHLYYSDRWLQRSNGWTHRALQTVGAEVIQWEDQREPKSTFVYSHPSGGSVI